MQTSKFPWLSLIAVFAFYGPSCRSSQPQTSTDEFALTNSVEFDDSLSRETNSNKSTTKNNDNALKVEQPVKADAWHTRKLIMIHTQPDPQQIMECKETVESAVAQADNLRELNEASIVVESKVATNLSIYHWCFYQLMADLDIRLDRDSPLLKDKADAFFSRMRTLWVLAKSLDEHRHSSTYTAYLRARYVDISQHVFGRNVENIDEESLLVTAGKSGKSASAFEDP